MTLTPSDIEQKTFSTALRGYNLDEVDDFLDEVVRSMRKLQEELETARSELETKSAEPEGLAEPVPAAPPVLAVVEAPPPPPVTPIDESALGKALIAAQETAERIVNDARSEADEILVRAKNEAETFEESRLLRKEEAEQEITRIDGLVNRVKAELADLSVAVGAELEEMSGAVDTAITDLDGSLGEPAGSEDDLAADDDLADDHDGQNIVGVGAEPLERDIDGADEPSSGRRRHRSESGAIEAEDDSEEDDSGNADSEEDDSGNADSEEDDSGNADS
ncbi:MAG: DivIVA domain-containing protein, partial [Acidimicrobiia bacterium]